MFDRERTKAPDDHIELAEKLRQRRNQPVHPDAWVDPTCPDSVELRAKQELRDQNYRKK